MLVGRLVGLRWGGGGIFDFFFSLTVLILKTLLFRCYCHQRVDWPWMNPDIPRLDIKFKGLVQERNFIIVVAMELRLSCTNPTIWCADDLTVCSLCIVCNGLANSINFYFETTPGCILSVPMLSYQLHPWKHISIKFESKWIQKFIKKNAFENIVPYIYMYLSGKIKIFVLASM